MMCKIGKEEKLLEKSEKKCNSLFMNKKIMQIYDLEVIKEKRKRGWKKKVIDIKFDDKEGNKGL